MDRPNYWRIKVSDGTYWSDWASAEFVWGPGTGGTGIDHTGEAATDSDTAESLGFTPLYSPEYIVAPCPEGCGGGSYPTDLPTLPRISSTTIFHEQRWNWCVPATLQTMLYQISGNTANYNSGAEKDQKRLKSLLYTIKTGGDVNRWYSDPSYRPNGAFGTNGISTNFGFTALNTELSRLGYQNAYDRKIPADSGDLKLIVQKDVGGKPGRPTFVEVDVRSGSWVWNNTHTFLGGTRSTHAISVIGYTDHADYMNIPDPNWKTTQSIATSTSGGYLYFTNAPPGYSKGYDYGKRWDDIPKEQLFFSLDVSVGGHKPVWY